LAAPSLSPAWETAEELMAWVRKVEVRLRQHLEEPAPPRPWLRDPLGRVVLGAPDGHMSTSLGYLLARSSALLAWDTRSPDPATGEVDGQAEAEVVGRQALAWSRRLERAAGADRLVHRLAAPCPDCDCRTLIRRDGEDRVECTTCAKSWPEHHYEFLVRLVLREEKAEEGA
jgi:hypothetical protein